jgi:hypothetical protein
LPKFEAGIFAPGCLALPGARIIYFRNGLEKKEIYMNTLRKILCILVVVFIGSCLSSCGTPHLYSQKDAFDLQYSPSRIPLKFDNGMPYLTVEIDGIPIDLDLDFGAEGIAIGLMKQTVEQLDVQHSGFLPHYSRSAKGKLYSGRKFRVKNLQIGRIQFRNLLCIYFDMPAPEPFTKRGIVGRKLLREFNVFFDYQHNQLLLYDQNQFPEELNLKTWDSFDVDERFLIYGTLDGCPHMLSIGFDTGLIAQDKNHRFFSIFRNSKLASGACSTLAAKKIVHNTSISSSGKTIDNLNILFYAFPIPKYMDLILGHDFFMKYQVFYDLHNRKIFLKKYTVSNT